MIELDVANWLRQRSLARPFLRWAGGKQPFLAKFEHHLPKLRARYIEPFLGSGAVFFHYTRLESRPFTALLADINLQLITTYQAIKRDPNRVAESLTALVAGYTGTSDKTEFYLEQRRIFNLTIPRVDPGRFVFINRTCWNGLYRVNRDGKFNVPHGASKGDIYFPRLDDFYTVHAALANTKLRATTWENTIGQAVSGDFIYADPPYFSECGQSGKTKYSRTMFTKESHFALADALLDVSKRGVDFLLCNSAEIEIVDYYKKLGFDVAPVEVPRFINSKPDLRVAADEVIVRPPEKGIKDRQMLLLDR